jgi:phytoene dehydrogenase-like protein
MSAKPADTIIDTVELHAPGFKASVLGTMMLSPHDLERKFGLVGGDIMHGNMSTRPALGRASAARPRQLPRADRELVHVRRRHTSRRRRDRRAGTQFPADTRLR